MTNDPMPPDAIGLRLNLTPADRDRLRVVAAQAGMSMAAYARKVVLEAVEKAETPKSKRLR
jgi:plasmid stability protein